MNKLLITCRTRQRGVGLIEVFIAITIGLFLLAGLFLLFSGMRGNYAAQNQMAQLQDDERLAMNMLAAVVQQAGYFPNPQVVTFFGAFPADTTFIQSGQVVTGTTTVSLTDSFAVRYLVSPANTATSDFILDCTGLPNPSTTATAMLVNVFTVNASNELTCSVNGGATRSLVGGIASFSVLYGVDPDGNGSVNQYLPASSMTVALWPTVISLRITVGFANPLAGQPGQAATLPFTRVFSVMSKV